MTFASLSDVEVVAQLGSSKIHFFLLCSSCATSEAYKSDMRRALKAAYAHENSAEHLAKVKKNAGTLQVPEYMEHAYDPELHPF